MKKQELLDLLETLPCRLGVPRNPRMAQLQAILATLTVSDSELPFFEREIAAFAAKSATAERKRLAYFRYASGASNA